jgi:hypothetical protein
VLFIFCSEAVPVPAANSVITNRQPQILTRSTMALDY